MLITGRIVSFDRGNFRFGFRHDIPSLNVNYGFNYRDGNNDNRPFLDIDNVENIGPNSFLNFYAEKVGLAGFTFRFIVVNQPELVLKAASCLNKAWEINTPPLIQFDVHLPWSFNQGYRFLDGQDYFLM